MSFQKVEKREVKDSKPEVVSKPEVSTTREDIGWTMYAYVTLYMSVCACTVNLSWYILRYMQSMCISCNLHVHRMRMIFMMLLREEMCLH